MPIDEEAERSIQIVLFFTEGMSLSGWADIGMLDREVAIYQHLNQYGVSTSFITYGGPRDLEVANGIPEIEVYCNRWMLPERAYASMLPILHGRILREADVYKTNQTNGATLAMNMAHRFSKPLIARCGYMWSFNQAKIHGEESREAQHALKVEEIVFTNADAINVTTERMAEDLRTRFAAELKVNVVPNYVDTTVFRPYKDRGEPEFDLLFIGRLSSEKNVAGILKAIEPLKDVTIGIVGDGSLKRVLQEEFAGMGDRIAWLGNIPNSQLPSIINRSRVFILASFYEGHPKVLIEAMACGVPVIGTDAPGIREILHHDENGILSGAAPEEIRSSIMRVMDDLILQKRLGKNAQAYVERHFSLEKIQRKELEIIKRVAER